MVSLPGYQTNITTSFCGKSIVPVYCTSEDVGMPKPEQDQYVAISFVLV